MRCRDEYRDAAPYIYGKEENRRTPYNRKRREYKEIKVCLGIEEMRVEELLLEAITLITFPQTSTSVE